MPGSSADIVGLHPKQIIAAIDGKAILDPQQLSVLCSAVFSATSYFTIPSSGIKMPTRSACSCPRE